MRKYFYIAAIGLSLIIIPSGLHSQTLTALTSFYSSGYSQDYVGIGFLIQKERKTDFFIIRELVENGPAYSAGLIKGDVITRIGDTPSKDLTINEAGKLLIGPKGTWVELVVKRNFSFKTIDVQRGAILF